MAAFLFAIIKEKGEKKRMEISQSQKAFNPSTTIYLLRGVPLDADYNLTLHFTSLSEQQAYFSKFRHSTFLNNTYQRINSKTLRVEKKADSILNCNYLMFQNGAGGKWIYCFIREINYINEVTSEIVYEIDLMQTYYLDYVVLPCYVEREHTASDALYSNLVQEGMSVNFYQKAAMSRSIYWNNWAPIVLTTLDKEGQVYTKEEPSDSESPESPESRYLASIDKQIQELEKRNAARDVDYPLPDKPEGSGGGNGSGLPANPSDKPSEDESKPETPETPSTSLAVGVSLVDNVFCACNIYSFGGISSYQKFFESVANNGTQDGIITAYMCPKNFIKGYSSTGIASVSSYANGQAPNSTITVNRFTGSFDGYTPKNNKLYTYPFCYILASSGDDSIEYKFEGFSGSSCQFQEYCSIIPSPTAMSVPLNYMENNQSSGTNLLYCLTMSNFPVCSYAIDSYKAWVAQNSNTLANTQKWIGIDTGISAAKSGVSTIASVLSGDVGGAVNGLMGVGESFINGQKQYDALNAKMKDAMKTPASATKPESGGVRFARSAKDFRYYTMVCDRTTAQSVDNYFTRYGYKCNLVKVPNDYVRRYFTFTQTIDCKITGNIPASDQTTIEHIYNKGITFWNPYAPTVGDYSLNNTPLGKQRALEAMKEDQSAFNRRMQAKIERIDDEE